VDDETVDLFRYEHDLRAQGYRWIAGIDESGRAAWAGPLVAAAVILPEDFDLDGIRDGKELTPNRREQAYERIAVDAVARSVCWSEPRTINQRGLHRCNLELLRRAVRKLALEPDYVLIDGVNEVPGIRPPSQTIVKGDAVSASIAAASIVAKVTRDRLMDRLHLRYLEYGFDDNRGYRAPRHLEALDCFGLTDVHRLNKGTRKFLAR